MHGGHRRHGAHRLGRSWASPAPPFQVGKAGSQQHGLDPRCHTGSRRVPPLPPPLQRVHTLSKLPSIIKYDTRSPPGPLYILCWNKLPITLP